MQRVFIATNSNKLNVSRNSSAANSAIPFQCAAHCGNSVCHCPIGTSRPWHFSGPSLNGPELQVFARTAPTRRSDAFSAWAIGHALLGRARHGNNSQRGRLLGSGALLREAGPELRTRHDAGNANSARLAMMRKAIYSAGGVLLAIAMAGFIIHRVDGEIVRHDPDTLPGSAGLMRYGIARGASIFHSHCATCHGKDGAGDASRGVPNLADDDWLYGSGSVSYIERIVAYGIRSKHPKSWNLAIMPAFAHAKPSPTDARIPPLSPAGIRDVIEYLLYLQKRPADAQAVPRGAQIYNNVGGCYDCHSTDAKGDTAIGAPNLVDPITLYGDGSRGALFESIANGRQGVCPAWVKILSAAAVREVSIYVYSLSHTAPSG